MQTLKHTKGRPWPLDYDCSGQVPKGYQSVAQGGFPRFQWFGCWTLGQTSHTRDHAALPLNHSAKPPILFSKKAKCPKLLRITNVTLGDVDPLALCEISHISCGEYPPNFTVM